MKPFIAISLLLLASSLLLPNPVNSQATTPTPQPVGLRPPAHLGPVLIMTFSQDGAMLASGSSGGPVQLWNTKTGQLLKSLAGPFTPVQSIAFSGDNKTVAAGTDSIFGWDITTGAAIPQVYAPDPVAGIALTTGPDGKILDVERTHQTLLFKDIVTGQSLKTFSNSQNFGQRVVSHNGKLLAAVKSEITYSIGFWDTSTGNLLRPMSQIPTAIYTIVFSPDDKLFAGSTNNSTIMIWDVNTGKLLNTLTLQPLTAQSQPPAISSLAFAADSKTVAVGRSDNVVDLWDTSTGKLLKTLSGSTMNDYQDYHGVDSVAFSPDGKSLAVGCADGRIILFDTQTGQPLPVQFTLSLAQTPHRRTPDDNEKEIDVRWPAHDDEINSVVFSPDGKTLASGSGGFNRDNSIKLWDANTGKLLQTFLGHTGAVTSLAFSPDGKTLASGSMDNTAKLWDVATGELQNTLKNQPSNGISTIAYSPDGKTVAIAGNSNSLILEDIPTGKTVEITSKQTSGVASLAFSPDGKTLALGGFGGIRFWDLGSNKMLRTLDVAVYGIAYSPDGTMLAAGMDSKIELWDTGTGHLLKTFSGSSKGQITSVAFSPDNKILASNTPDAGINLWDVGTGSLIKAIPQPEGRFGAVTQSLAYSPDGKTLAAGRHNGTIILWDTQSFQPLSTEFDDPAALP